MTGHGTNCSAAVMDLAAAKYSKSQCQPQRSRTVRPWLERLGAGVRGLENGEAEAIWDVSASGGQLPEPHLIPLVR